MSTQAAARALLAGLCAVQGLATAIIDLNRTHATNPEWTGHARFHVVWQTATVVLLAALEIALLLGPGPLEDQRFYLAAMLAALPMCGFFIALIARRAFRGTLSDPNGMKPLILRTRKSKVRIDLNLVAEIIGSLALAILIALYRHADTN